jgi:hypothetical protein
LFHDLEAFGIGHVHAAKLAAPDVKRGITETILAAELPYRNTGLGLLRKAEDLLFGKTLFDVRLLF